MKPKTTRQAARHRASTKNCRAFRSTAAPALLALASWFTPTLSAQVVAGWDVFSGTGAADPASAPVVAGGVTASFETTTEGRTWTTNDERGASSDGDWGTSFGPPAADTTVGNANDQNLTLPNAATGATMTLTLTNNGTVDLALAAFHFDAYAFRPKAPRTYELSVLPGGALSEGVIHTSAADEITSVSGANSNTAHDDIDHALDGLADATLEVGGTVQFLLAFSGGAGDDSGGHHLFIDNIAVTGGPPTSNELVVTSVPATVTAGDEFSVTVEAQNGGSPYLVSEDTEILLGTSGAGPITGNTAIIPAGSSSVTLPTMQATLVETITLTAAQTSGDVLATSAPSSEIVIQAGAASQLVVEDQGDGSGEPVGDRTVIIGEELTVYAISRDSAGNFIALESGAAFSLINITGNIFSFDLTDNGDGSAVLNTFEGISGTCNIQATVAGLPDGVSGLLTIQELVNRWDGDASNVSWSTAINWLGDTLPAFDNSTDLFFANPEITKRNTYIGFDRTVRSVNFDVDAGGQFTASFVEAGNTNPANLTFDTDSTTDPAEFNVAAESVDDITFGRASFVSPANAGAMILADNLRVSHEGSGLLTLNRTIQEVDGPKGIIKEGSGTLLLSGANSFTGNLEVNGGYLALGGVAAAPPLAAVSVASGAALGGRVAATGGLSDADLQAIIDEVNWAADGSASLVIDTAGEDVTVGANITGDIGLIKKGEGVLTLTGTNTFTGATVVEAGSIVEGEEEPAGIEITGIARTGTQVTMSFTADGSADVYKSTDLQDFGAGPIATDVAPGEDVVIDAAAAEASAFYLLVPTGDPAP